MALSPNVQGRRRGPNRGPCSPERAMYLFRGLNGLRIDASEEQVVTVLTPSSFLQASPAHRVH